MRAAFAVENVPRLASAFALALLRFFAAAHIGTRLVAAGDFLLAQYNRRFLFF
jgi:hypothetical protein